MLLFVHLYEFTCSKSYSISLFLQLLRTFSEKSEKLEGCWEVPWEVSKPLRSVWKVLERIKLWRDWEFSERFLKGCCEMLFKGFWEASKKFMRSLWEVSVKVMCFCEVLLRGSSIVTTCNSRTQVWKWQLWKVHASWDFLKGSWKRTPPHLEPLRPAFARGSSSRRDLRIFFLPANIPRTSTSTTPPC